MTAESFYIPNFDAEKHPIIYHYCSTSTFLSIVQRRCIWLSDINTMNDYGETRWAYERFVEAANVIVEDVGLEFIDEADKIVSASQLRILPMLASFSTDGDVLSQWRAYADDGRGIAIGFDARLIESLSLRIAPVEYAHELQVEYLVKHLRFIWAIWTNLPSEKRTDFLFTTLAHFSNDLAFFKNPAFAEEKEVRVLRALVVDNKDGEWKLTDHGGTGERKSRKKLPVLFRAAGNGGVISYIEMPIDGLGARLIKRVIIGPKSQNGGPEVSMVLSAAGFQGAEIAHSEATYR